MSDVGRNEETLGISVGEGALHSGRRRADERESAVAVMAVPDARERALAADEERRLAVRRTLARLGQGEADLAHDFENALFRHERDLALRAGESSAARTRGSSSPSRDLRT